MWAAGPAAARHLHSTAHQQLPSSAWQLTAVWSQSHHLYILQVQEAFWEPSRRKQASINYKIKICECHLLVFCLSVCLFVWVWRFFLTLINFFMLHSNTTSFLLLLKITPCFAQEQVMKPKGSRVAKPLYRNRATKVNSKKLIFLCHFSESFSFEYCTQIRTAQLIITLHII